MTEGVLAAEPCVAGARILKMREVAEERFGREALTRALAAVPEATRAEYEALTAMSWLPTAHDYAVHDALAEEVGIAAVDLHHALLREAMSRSFKTLWRVFLRFTSDDALMRRAPSIYARTRNVGDVHIDLLGEGHAAMRVENYPRMSARDARCIAIGLEVVLTLTGRKGVRITDALAGSGASYDLTWR